MLHMSQNTQYYEKYARFCPKRIYRGSGSALQKLLQRTVRQRLYVKQKAEDAETKEQGRTAKDEGEQYTEKADMSLAKSGGTACNI